MTARVALSRPPAVALDVETVPDIAAVEQILASPPPFEAPRNYKDPDKIAEYVEAAEKEWRRKTFEEAALSKFRGRVAAIAVVECEMVEDDAVCGPAETPAKQALCHDDEARVLAWTAEQVSALGDAFGAPPRVVTFNGFAFDAPFIAARCMAHGVAIPEWITRQRRYAVDPHCDLRMILSDWDRHAPGKLTDWLRLCGLPAVESTDPAWLADAFVEGRHDEIEALNLADAVATARLYNHCVRCGVVS